MIGRKQKAYFSNDFPNATGGAVKPEEVFGKTQWKTVFEAEKRDGRFPKDRPLR